MITQVTFTLPPFPRGYHLVTEIVKDALETLPKNGLLNLFILHTSAGLTINENADTDVRRDFETIFDRLVPENISGIRHTIEGPDDMPAHIKASLVGSSLSIPIRNGALDLGTWQGIYLCEFRNRGGARRLTATVLS